MPGRVWQPYFLSGTLFWPFSHNRRDSLVLSRTSKQVQDTARVALPLGPLWPADLSIWVICIAIEIPHHLPQVSVWGGYARCWSFTFREMWECKPQAHGGLKSSWKTSENPGEMSQGGNGQGDSSWQQGRNRTHCYTNEGGGELLKMRNQTCKRQQNGNAPFSCFQTIFTENVKLLQKLSPTFLTSPEWGMQLGLWYKILFLWLFPRYQVLSPWLSSPLLCFFGDLSAAKAANAQPKVPVSPASFRAGTDACSSCHRVGKPLPRLPVPVQPL
jgi:hypothetical protein